MMTWHDMTMTVVQTNGHSDHETEAASAGVCGFLKTFFVLRKTIYARATETGAGCPGRLTSHRCHNSYTTLMPRFHPSFEFVVRVQTHHLTKNHLHLHAPLLASVQRRAVAIFKKTAKEATSIDLHSRLEVGPLQPSNRWH